MDFNHVMRWSCLWFKFSIINNRIAKWRLGAWDVQGLPQEAYQPAPGPKIALMARNPGNPAMDPQARDQGILHTGKQWRKSRRGSGEQPN